MARRKKNSIQKIAMQTIAAGAGGAATGFVTKAAADIAGPDMASPIALAASGAVQYFSKNELLKAAGLGMAGVAGGNLAVELFPDEMQAVRTQRGAPSRTS